MINITQTLAFEYVKKHPWIVVVLAAILLVVVVLIISKTTKVFQAKKMKMEGEKKVSFDIAPTADIDFSSLAEMGGVKIGKENNDSYNQAVDPSSLLPENIRVQQGDKPHPAGSSASYSTLGTLDVDKELENNMFATFRVPGFLAPDKPQTAGQINYWKGSVDVTPRLATSVPVRADFFAPPKVDDQWS